MKFKSLQLHRYGLFETRDLNLADTHGLVVIYGPNEAGKSTLLAAVSDFLFGIHERSPHGQRFGYDQMRVSAQIELADGSVHALRRLKARGARALTDESGKPTDDGSLAASLGGMRREKYEALFGLNHASLRTGGENLLAADGDIGRLIVEAGGGLRSLVARLAALDAEASALFATRKSSERAFYKGLDAFTAAERVVKTGTLTFEACRTAERDVAARKASLETLRQRRKETTSELLSLQRSVRVAPVIRELSQCSSQLNDLADVLSIDREFAARATKAIEDHESASLASTTCAETAAELLQKRDSVAVEAALISKEAAIRDISNKASHVSRERADRRKREMELQTSKSKLANLRRAIEADESDDLKVNSPEARMVARVQEVAAIMLELTPQLKHNLTQIKDLRTALSEGKILQEMRAEEGVDKPLAIREADFDRLPSLTAELGRRRKDLASRKARLLAECLAVGASDVQSVRDLLWPSPSEIEQELRDRKELVRETQLVATEQRGLASKISKTKQILERTQKDGDLPTPSAIASAREARDGSWTKIRRLFLEPGEASWIEVNPEARDLEATTFETAKMLADNLADRKGDEAQRIADAQRARADLDEYLIEANALFEATTELNARQIMGRNNWLKNWPDAADHSEQLEPFRTLVERRLAALKAADESDERFEQFEVLEAEELAAQRALATAEHQLGIKDQDESTLEQRIANVACRIAEHLEAHTDYRSVAANLKAQAIELKQLETLYKSRESEKNTFDTEWASLMPKIGIGADSSPQLATQVATAWAAADGVFDAISQTQRRLDRMDEDERELQDLVVSLGVEVGLTLPSDVLSAADMLAERWEATKANADKQAQLTHQFEAAQTQAEKAHGTLKVAILALEVCCVEANCTINKLPSIIERCRQANSLRDRVSTLTESLSAASDDVRLVDLEDAINSRSIDELQVAEMEIESEAVAIAEELEAAVRALQEAEQIYASMVSVNTTSAAIADREAAAADLGRIAQRYVELVLVRNILEAAIERVRSEQQDPLVMRAAELFALCTRGEFTGIETDVDDKGSPIVLGRRIDDTTVRVGTMSDGTRDQLYLSFRLASIEHYAKATEPLPFIADDILVHFDDSRSVATLNLLAEFGQKTQVILFTHHESVLSAAKKLADDGLASVIELH